MDKTKIEEIKNIFDSIICLAAEGPEVMKCIELVDKIAKESERGYNLCCRHLTNAMYSDDENNAVYCGGCGFTHKPSKCPDGLNGSR